MKERYDSPAFYDHVFYPTKSWKLIGVLLLLPIFGLGVFYFREWLDGKIVVPFWLKLSIVAAFTVFFVVPMIIFRLYQRNKVQIGIGKAGLYVRGMGQLLTWSEIKGIDLVKHPKHGKAIKIRLYSPIDQGEQPSTFSKIVRFVGPVFGESPDIMYLYGKEFISVPLDQLHPLLRTYHDQYKAEEIEREQPFVQEKVEVESEKKDWGSRVPMVWRKLLIAAVISLVVTVYGWVTGEEAFWIFGPITFVIYFIGMFRPTRLLFTLIVSAVFLVAGLGFFFYSLIWQKKFEWEFLLVAVVGPLLFFRIWFVKKEKKLST